MGPLGLKHGKSLASCFLMEYFRRAQRAEKSPSWAERAQPAVRGGGGGAPNGKQVVGMVNSRPTSRPPALGPGPHNITQHQCTSCAGGVTVMGGANR